jgi:hypothetical protein
LPLFSLAGYAATPAATLLRHFRQVSDTLIITAIFDINTAGCIDCRLISRHIALPPFRYAIFSPHFADYADADAKAFHYCWLSHYFFITPHYFRHYAAADFSLRFH